MMKIFMYSDLSALKKNSDANFQLVQFSELSIGSVIPLTHPRLDIRHLNTLYVDIYAWTFKHEHLGVDIYAW